MDRTLNEFYKPACEPPRYPGQLDPHFQEQLQEAHAEVTEKDCNFYHTLDLGGGRTVPGAWDIRGNEQNYLGHIDFNGLRALEFGPASGYLSFWLESQGADVVAVDLPPGHPPDLVPLPGIDLAKNGASGALTATAVRNSWWFAHKALNSNAAAIYADIYGLPDDIGRFDVSTFGAILLHLKRPFCALQEAARKTDKAIVITDLIPEILYGTDSNNFVEFNPGNESENLVNWWTFTPVSIARMLRVLGFPHVDIHYFENTYHPHHKVDRPATSRFMFTAVGQREKGMLTRVEKKPADIDTDRRIREVVPAISVDGFNDAHRRLKDAHEELEAIYRSLPWKLTKPLRMLLGGR